MAIGAYGGIMLANYIPGPDVIEPIVGAWLGAKLYDFSNGDTSISLPMDMGAYGGLAGAALGFMYPVYFESSVTAAIGAGVGEFAGSMFG